MVTSTGPISTISSGQRALALDLAYFLLIMKTTSRELRAIVQASMLRSYDQALARLYGSKVGGRFNPYTPPRIPVSCKAGQYSTQSAEPTMQKKNTVDCFSGRGYLEETYEEDSCLPSRCIPRVMCCNVAPTGKAIKNIQGDPPCPFQRKHSCAPIVP